MRSLPQRQSLVSQTAAILREEITRGAWRDWLPGERTLCDEFQISRNTLRAALRGLAREGLIRAEHGAGSRILGAATPVRRSRSPDVALLSPNPLSHLRPSQTLWIDELRAALGERGCRLHVFHGRQFFCAHPGRALQKLTTQHPHGAWVLTLSNEAIQRWFVHSGLPCVVAGSVHAGLPLPSRDLDHTALCRHAAGTLFGLGHRRIALLIPTSHLAGDLESETGFLDGARQSSRVEAEATVARHDGTVAGIGRALGRLLLRPRPPTALVVANAYHYLTVCGGLTRLGRRVPDDVSVISRDEDPFLSFVVPEPARYVTNPTTFAKTLLEPVLDLLDGHAIRRATVRLMPEFVRGGSTAPPTAPPAQSPGRQVVPGPHHY